MQLGKKSGDGLSDETPAVRAHKFHGRAVGVLNASAFAHSHNRGRARVNQHTELFLRFPGQSPIAKPFQDERPPSRDGRSFKGQLEGDPRSIQEAENPGEHGTEDHCQHGHRNWQEPGRYYGRKGVYPTRRLNTKLTLVSFCYSAIVNPLHASPPPESRDKLQTRELLAVMFLT